MWVMWEIKWQKWTGLQSYLLLFREMHSNIPYLVLKVMCCVKMFSSCSRENEVSQRLPVLCTLWSKCQYSCTIPLSIFCNILYDHDQICKFPSFTILKNQYKFQLWKKIAYYECAKVSIKPPGWNVDWVPNRVLVDIFIVCMTFYPLNL